MGGSDYVNVICVHLFDFNLLLKEQHADMIVAYNALTYYDRFLARNFDIPVIVTSNSIEMIEIDQQHVLITSA